MTELTHECLGPDCYRSIPLHMLACSAHARLIHDETKRALTRALRSGNVAAHAQAMADAIEDMTPRPRGARR